MHTISDIFITFKSFSNYVDPKLDVKDVDGDTLTFNIVQTPSAESTYFAINQSTGVITHALNYDVDNGVHPSVVTLKVVCVDAGGLTGYLQLLFF
ncbi:hypothetical protein DPMN_181677 [Dreissena polymorpha]|uniref:Cadherin domain-containing protein n=1 Tax=Dreissena polymorpha TaxID=45954 RepID=A0A9D4DDB6_DREPO|nr:hypothetical protein DPMN_181677 [Dreissena polymorpha]